MDQATTSVSVTTWAAAKAVRLMPGAGDRLDRQAGADVPGGHGHAGFLGRVGFFAIRRCASIRGRGRPGSRGTARFARLAAGVPVSGYAVAVNGVDHIPVLPEAVLDVLQPRAGQTVLDGTVGRGGHASLIIPRLGPGGRYVGLDLDPGNAEYARRRLEPIAAEAGVRLDVRHAGFQDAGAVLRELGLPRVDAVLADLGFASNQMDNPARGFAFSESGPLDMRLDPTARTTAADLVNRLPERELADLLYELGEERLSRKIARKIAERRQSSPIQTTSELADLVYRVYGPRARSQKIHPATRTFMALRIAVNDELGNLERLLSDLPSLLSSGGASPGEPPNGRAAIISFHSLEDRRVKQRFVELERQGHGRRLTKKPIGPSDDEVADNPRSRSAKLRAFEFGRQTAEDAKSAEATG